MSGSHVTLVAITVCALVAARPLHAEQHGTGYGPPQDDEPAYGGGQGSYVVAPLAVLPYPVVPAYPYPYPSYAAPYVPAPPAPAGYGYAPAPNAYDYVYARPRPRALWRGLPPLRPPPYAYPYGYGPP